MNFEQALIEAKQGKIIYHTDDEGDYFIAFLGKNFRKRLVRKVEGERRTIVSAIPAEWLFDGTWCSKEKELSKEDLREKVRQLNEEKEKLEKQVQDLERKSKDADWMKEMEKRADYEHMRNPFLWRDKR